MRERVEDIMNDKKKKYQLFAFPLKQETIEEATKHRFNRINNKYVLVYEVHDKVYAKNNAYHIISEKEIGCLTEAEKLWLIECNTILIAEESNRKSDDIMKSFGEKLNRLEEELKREAESLENGTDSEQE